MITTMDAAGRIVLPKAVRERAQITPGAPLEVQFVDGRIQIEPACAAVTIEKSAGLWVAAPNEPVPTLTQAEVNATVEELRVPRSDAARRRG